MSILRIYISDMYISLEFRYQCSAGWVSEISSCFLISLMSDTYKLTFNFSSSASLSQSSRALPGYTVLQIDLINCKFFRNSGSPDFQTSICFSHAKLTKIKIDFKMNINSQVDTVWQSILLRIQCLCHPIFDFFR